MNLFELIFKWYSFLAMLAALAVGQTADSPSFYVTYQDGRRFRVNFHAEREA